MTSDSADNSSAAEIPGKEVPRVPIHTPAQERVRLIILLVVMALLGSLYPVLARTSYRGSADLHATIEMVGALVGLMAGFALVMRFYTLGNRFYFIVGIAFFVNGAEDLIHGLLSFEIVHGFTGAPASSLEQFIPGTYVSGRLMLGLLLLAAPFVKTWAKKSERPKLETLWVSSAAIIFTIIAAAVAFALPLPQFIYPQRFISRPADFLSAVILLLALIVFLREYHRTRDMLLWWISLAIGINAVGQVLMSFSKELYDVFFDIAHLCKVLGYAAPLLGFSLYQIAIIAQAKRTTEALEKERDFSSAVLDTVGALVVIIDTAGRILGFNRASEEVSGYSSEEVEGKIFYDFLLIPEEVGPVRAVVEELSAGQFPNEFENFWVKKDGTRRLIHWTNTAIIAEDGSVEYIVATGIDVTERRRAEDALRKSEERYRELFEYAHDLIFTVDTTSGMVTTANDAARDVLSYEPNELVDQPYSAFVNPGDLSGVQEQMAVAISDTASTIEAWCMRKDGTPVLLELRMRSIPVTGEEATVHVIAYDVTERRKESEAAARLSQILRQRVREKTASLEEANRNLLNTQAQLIEAERLAAVGQLAAGVAHEINNPLSFVSNNLAVLRRDFRTILDVCQLYEQAAVEQDPEERRRLTEQVRTKASEANLKYITDNLERVFDRTAAGAERINKIVSDMRDFSRLGEADWKEVNINDAIDTTTTILLYDIRAKNIQLEKNYQELTPVHCMSGRINQVLLNVLTNAIEAAPEGGRITISTQPYEEGVKIAIEDNGPGMPQENLRKIFEPFFTTKPGGSGLGLSISRSIITDHKGRIEVESREGAGTTFTILLPSG